VRFSEKKVRNAFQIKYGRLGLGLGVRVRCSRLGLDLAIWSYQWSHGVIGVVSAVFRYSTLW